MQRFAVFASGHGTNLQAIMDAVKAGTIKAELALVFADRASAFALKRASEAGIETLCLRPKDYTNPQSFERDVVIKLKERKIDFIILAGYMKLLSPFFIKEYPNKIINIHPSLLPSFKGMFGIKEAFQYGVKVSGVTIHFVDEKTDHGPIIAQQSVPIEDADTLEILTEKIHQVEHQIYPKVVALMADGRLKVAGRKVEIL